MRWNFPIGNNLKVLPMFILKETIFRFFPELGKIEKSSQSNIQKPQNLFVNWEKPDILRLTLKNLNFESLDELGKVRS